MSSDVSLSFLGAAGTVTGSRYLIATDRRRVLVDCGMFQGYKNLRERNWQPFPVLPASIDTLFLTHAHLDHSGYIPVLVSGGFKGDIYCTEATYDLCKILLLDAAHIQEEEAKFRNSHHFTKHTPAKPLYDIEQARQALTHFRPVRAGQPVDLGEIKVTFHPNGHILGSSYLDMEVEGKHILFSGDVGRPDDLIMRAPEPPCACDYLVVESTYGDRLHERQNLQEMVSTMINDTVLRGGSVLIPAFAVGRAQSILYLLQKLRRNRQIPYVPIYLDSPMAISATELMIRHHHLHRLSADEARQVSDDVIFTRTVEESIELNHNTVPAIIISASGMATGGRVLHHLQHMLGNYRNTVIFAGFQAGGTRGARLVGGATDIKLFGQFQAVKARIEHLDFLSAHADRDELLDWLRQMPVAPKRCFVTHGEPEAADMFRIALQEQLGWKACTPEQGETVILRG